MKWYLAFTFSAFLLLGCNKQTDQSESKTIDNVKTIETIFLSHQADTEEKDDKIVAVVELLPDGSIESAMQYMTYPYTQMEKDEFKFWTEPNIDMLFHLLDGLSLGHAEKNFLYGHSWPVDYVAMIERKGHPEFPKEQEFFSDFISTTEYSENLPIFINTEPGFNENKNWGFGGYEEKFNYDSEKVTTYEWRHVISEKMLLELQEAEEKAERSRNGKAKSSPDSTKIEGSSFQLASFEYEGENLIKVIEKEREHRFQYENNRLQRSEYYIKDVLRNYRLYYYKDNGLKEKTVIFNTNNEPEYTIKYQYTFYEES